MYFFDCASFYIIIDTFILILNHDKEVCDQLLLMVTDCKGHLK